MMYRELKRREARRAKEARKVEKAATALQNDAKPKDEVKPSEDDLNPNVRTH